MRSRVSAIRPRAARVVVAARASSSAPRRACLRAANASTRRRDRVVARMGFFDNLFKKKDGDGDGENDGDDDAAADASASSSAPASSAPATASPAANEDPGPPVAAQRVEYQSLKSMPKATDTLSALDALLGESEEEKARKAQDAADEAAYEASKTAAAKKKAEIAAAVMASADEKDGGASSAAGDDDAADGVNVSISPNALKALRDAERARATGGEKDKKDADAATDEKDGAVDARGGVARRRRDGVGEHVRRRVRVEGRTRGHAKRGGGVRRSLGGVFFRLDARLCFRRGGGGRRRRRDDARGVSVRRRRRRVPVGADVGRAHQATRSGGGVDRRGCSEEEDDELDDVER